jgi:hypothetical protein
MALADVTGDGRSDVVVSEDEPGFASKDDKMHSHLAVYPGTRTGLGAPSAVDYTVNGGYALTVLTGDVDGDGRAEIVQLSDDSVVTVRVAQYTTGLQRPKVWGALDYYGYEFGLSDVNGDGTADLQFLDRTKTGITVDVSLSAHGQFGSQAQWLSWRAPKAQTQYVSLVKQGSGL